MHLFPFLKVEALLLHVHADAGWAPAEDVFHDGNEDAERIVAQKGPLGDLREIFVLGDGNRQAFEAVDVQHDMDVRTAVPDIDDAVLADREFLPQMVEDCDLAVSGSQAEYVADFAVLVIGEPAREDVVRRYDAFQG